MKLIITMAEKIQPTAIDHVLAFFIALVVVVLYFVFFDKS